jgi:hypothetical protein
MARTSGNRAYIIAVIASTIVPCGAAALMAGGGHDPDPHDEGAVPHVHHEGGVLRYEIRGTLDPDESIIRADETIRWTNTSHADVGRVVLHLYLEAFRSADTAYRREGAADGIEYEGWGGIDLLEVFVDANPVEPRKEQTWVSIPLPHRAKPGESVTIELSFNAHLPPLVERTGCVPGFCFAGQWYPKVMNLRADGTWPLVPYHHNSEYDARPAVHDVRMDVPEGWAVAGTGGAVMQEGHPSTGSGVRTWRFGGLLKDVAFAAGEGFRIATGRATTGTTLEVLHPARRGRESRRVLDLLAGSLPIMHARYGPLAYRNLVVVIVPRDGSGAGGMEYPGLFTIPGTDPSWSPAKVRESVFYHELMHMVFFGAIDTDEGREPWIDEGLTTATALWLQAELETGERSEVGRIGRLVLDPFEALRIPLVMEQGWHPARRAAWEYGSNADYGCAAYARTAIVLETARRLLGDAPMREALSGLVQDRSGRRTTGQDVERAFSRAYGGTFLLSYLRPALDSPEPFNLSVSSIDEGITLHRTGEAGVEVDVRVTYETGDERTVEWLADAPETRLLTGGPGPIRSVLVDPGGKVVLDTNRLDNGMDRDALHAGRSLSFTGLVLLVVQAIGALVMP